MAQASGCSPGARLEAWDGGRWPWRLPVRRSTRSQGDWSPLLPQRDASRCGGMEMHGRPEGAARRASGNRGRDRRRAGSRRASRARRRWPRRGPRTAGCALRFGAGSPGRRRSPKADGATSRRAVERTSERRCGDEAAGHPVKPGPCAFAGCGPIAPLRFGRLFWRHLVGTRWRDLSARSGGSRVACRNASVRFRGQAFRQGPCLHQRPGVHHGRIRPLSCKSGVAGCRSKAARFPPQRRAGARLLARSSNSKDHGLEGEFAATVAKGNTNARSDNCCGAGPGIGRRLQGHDGSRAASPPAGHNQSRAGGDRRARRLQRIFGTGKMKGRA